VRATSIGSNTHGVYASFGLRGGTQAASQCEDEPCRIRLSALARVVFFFLLYSNITTPDARRRGSHIRRPRAVFDYEQAAAADRQRIGIGHRVTAEGARTCGRVARTVCCCGGKDPEFRTRTYQDDARSARPNAGHERGLNDMIARLMGQPAGPHTRARFWEMYL